MDELAVSVSGILDEVSTSGESSLRKDRRLASLLEGADCGAWKDIASTLDILGYRVPADRLPADWVGELRKLDAGLSFDQSTPLPEVANAILRLLSLDGEYVLPRLPETGELGLDSRILQYRLKHFRLYNYQIGLPYNDSDRVWEAVLRSWLRISPEVGVLDIANALGDIDRLWELFMAGDPGASIVAIEGSLESSWAIEPLDAILASWRDTGAALPAPSSSIDSQGLVLGARNEFGRCLIRTTLWIDGLLENFPTCALPLEDTGSLVRSLAGRGYEYSPSSPGPLGSLFRRTGEKLWVVRLDGGDGFVQRFRPEGREGADNPGTAATGLGRLLLDPSGKETDQVFFQRLDLLLERADTAPETEPANPVLRLLKRAYRGIKRAFQWILDLVRQGLEWLRQHVIMPIKDFLSKALMSIVRGWKYFAGTILPKAKAFFSGLALSADRTGRSFALTKFYPDLDVTQVVGAGADEALLAAHIERIDRVPARAKAALNLGGLVLGAIFLSAAGPVGWAQAAFRIGAISMDYLGGIL